MPSDELMSKLPKEIQSTIRKSTKLGMNQYKKLKASERKHLQQSRDAFLKSLRSRLDTIIWLGDVDAFDRLLTQTEILLAYEQLKIIREKGLQKDFEAILDKAGNSELEIKNIKEEKP
jgi:hypothetical protein